MRYQVNDPNNEDTYLGRAAYVCDGLELAYNGAKGKGNQLMRKKYEPKNVVYSIITGIDLTKYNKWLIPKVNWKVSFDTTRGFKFFKSLS